MGDPMKIRASMQGDVAEIRVLVNHAMETGQRKDSAGNLVPAHFIKHLTATVGDKLVVDAQIGTAISRNPVFAFKVKGAKAGDKVVINWQDNKGDSRTDEAVIA
ncbi:MAG TPA: thiosulfate oxidation carrier complex protein SoxZ [Rhodocyclaceae bacterium]|jgi:sulfur-oxidizing protein SoxZ|nr:thiosulfate oxidation carrier complex protein SoxZ [Rhodocyclaceae bacterium]HMV55086.1 thiosulfate oxidation carrier complex protein SoxZ [Rhodocyclaceae bacterium]HNA03003.1 thiosulfate oxidation carrier complex protein SoxZ [Rhodocyclaceae bacterium]HNB77807.1 thiosulfate oxidation carrier complex protein SoxZ [Rhodocyclaceae bacterium]HNC62854.1 thiosulfate oxidation carrier complex protein SoxZ [Rhodocyclaceae bacterium]